MNYSHLFFDLDGTLTDSAPGVINSMRYALGEMGVDFADVDFQKFMGPPLFQSFASFFPGDEAKTRQALGVFRERYVQVGMLAECSLYPGVAELIPALARVCVLTIVTSKAQDYAGKVLEHFGLSRFFAGLYAPALDTERFRKLDYLSQALADSGAEKARALMVGDRLHDMEAAGQAGIDALGVAYGYGGAEELRAYGPVFLAESPEAVGRYLLGK